jgi:hypothetical protein
MNKDYKYIIYDNIRCPEYNEDTTVSSPSFIKTTIFTPESKGLTATFKDLFNDLKTSYTIVTNYTSSLYEKEVTPVFNKDIPINL